MLCCLILSCVSLALCPSLPAAGVCLRLETRNDAVCTGQPTRDPATGLQQMKASWVVSICAAPLRPPALPAPPVGATAAAAAARGPASCCTRCRCCLCLHAGMLLAASLVLGACKQPSCFAACSGSPHTQRHRDLCSPAQVQYIEVPI